MEILSAEDVLRNGIEFDGDVCYSGENYDQVCTNEVSEGGVPINGILYERYKNGNLCYYSFYQDGIPHGPCVHFYESGKIQSYCVMDTATVEGEMVELYENGNVKLREYSQYGYTLRMQKFDVAGNLIDEKKELREDERAAYEKCVTYYEHWEDKKRYINIQNELRKQTDFNNSVNIEKIKNVAGVDLAYWNVDGEEYAACCIVVLDYATKEVVEKKYVVGKVTVPYISGCLAFREMPFFLQAYGKIESDVDVWFFDGNGYLHPQHMGLASHAGIAINSPTVGIAKSYLKIYKAEFCMPDEEQFSYSDIKVGKEVYGRVLRTQSGVKPVYLSIGNKIDLDTAMQLTDSLVTKESHIPLPTRLADIMTHEIRNMYT